MEYIRVANLRCLADTPRIELKPLTFLVGANSAGKSTFLRVLPLLKQSVEGESLSGLTLNERYVSFGFFDEVLRHGAEPPELRIQLGYTTYVADETGTPPWYQQNETRFQASCEISYVQRMQNPRFPRISSVTIRIGDQTFEDELFISAEEDGSVRSLRINNTDLDLDLSAYRFRLGRFLIPRLRFDPQDESSKSLHFHQSDISPIDAKLLEVVTPFFHGNASKARKAQTVRGIKFDAPTAMLASMQEASSSSWKANVKAWTTSTPAFISVRNLIIAARFNNFIDQSEAFLTRLAGSVHYFAPVRASVERDYPNRDVSVTAVDPVGGNIAIFLASLSESAQKNFRSWMKEKFGIEVYTQILDDGARIALKLREADSSLVSNLADTGFGFSQMLPFLVQIWSLSSGAVSPKRPSYGSSRWQSYSPRGFGYTIAIEQPELHLHPALQAKLAEVIVNTLVLSKAHNIPIRFMLETHSQSMIERVGQLVEKLLVEADDVQIVLFETKPHGSKHDAYVSIAKFDSTGVLTGWPFGFLSPQTV